MSIPLRPKGWSFLDTVIMISYSRETGIEINKLIDLVSKNIVKGLGWCNEDIFISIYKNALTKPENEAVKDNFLSKNSEMMDK